MRKKHLKKNQNDSMEGNHSIEGNDTKQPEKNFFDSTTSVDSVEDSTKFDIRNYMNYDLICRMLIQHPTEASLFAVTCILINEKVNDKK